MMMEMEMEMMMPFSIVVTGRRCVCLLSFQHCYLFCSHHRSNLFFFFGCNFDYDSVCGVPPHMV
jgi:hypothetical protein